MNCFKRCFGRLASVFLLLFSFSYFLSGQPAEDIEHILNSLSPPFAGLSGYTITAWQTNIFVNANAIPLRFLQSKSTNTLSGEQIKALKTMSNRMPKSETNVVFTTFRFESNYIEIVNKEFNVLGRLLHKSRTLATPNEVIKYYYPDKASTSSEKKIIGRAEIRNRSTNVLFGVPIFLSKITLYDLVKNSPFRLLETGESLGGQKCKVITLSGTPNTPVAKFKLYLQSDTLTPVGLNSYLADGTLYSRTDLQFEYPEAPPFLCKRADYQIFSDGRLFLRSVWVIDRIVRNNLSPSGNVKTFIPPGTQVWDHRFSRPLNYHMGAHPPTPAQIRLMLASTTGVASYEAGINIRPGTSKISSERRNWIRVIVIIVIITPLLIFLPKLLRKR